MVLRKFMALVVDNYNPIKFFWTFEGAKEYKHHHNKIVILYRWTGTKWIKIEPWEEGLL